MLFSSNFDIQRTDGDDWFDPILDVDTKLFVDPFLVYRDSTEEWKSAHQKLIAYFQQCFDLIARSGSNRNSLQWQKAESLLRFPEPREFCLGYVASGTAGSGGGRGHAKSMAGAMAAAVQRGIKSLVHFEELGIFSEGIGPDRISDIVCNILKPEIISYTQKMARKHRIPLARARVNGATFDHVRGAWIDGEVELPVNPFSGDAVLLVPARFLRELPVLNAEDWFNSSEAASLRLDMNLDVMDRVDKATIVQKARENPNLVAQWVAAMESRAVEPYDLERDPLGVYRWDPETKKFVMQNPIALDAASSLDEFRQIIERLIEQYTLFIEEQGGWRLLWNGRKEKPEEAAQLAFLGVARGYCAANDIVVDREVQLGRGPVDFKFSNGFRCRAHLEMKKLHNGKFWQGLRKQLPSYMKSDECPLGWFIAIQYRDTGASERRAQELQRLLPSSPTECEVRIALIDAQRKASASKIKDS